MTTNEVREYLKSYRNYKDRVAYIDNKVLNVHSIQYNNVKGRTSEPKTQNDYILMKEKCKKEMESIKQTVEKVNNITYRNILFLSLYRMFERVWYCWNYGLLLINGKSVYFKRHNRISQHSRMMLF